MSYINNLISKMLDNIISNRIIEFYKKYYIKNERKLFMIDINNKILGGKYGLSLLLNNEPNLLEIPQIYSKTPEKTSRELANSMYKKSPDEYIHVRTVISNREYEVKNGTRIVANVFENYNNDFNIIEREYVIADEAVKCGFIPLIVYLITILKEYINPLMYDDRAKNADMISKLVSMLDFDALYTVPGKTIRQERIEDDKNVSRSLRELLLNYVHVITTTNRHIYIINTSCAEFMDGPGAEIMRIVKGTKINKYSISLPGEFFLEKVVIHTKDKHSYIFYNQAQYDIIGYHNVNGIRQAIPSVVLMYVLIEDNSGLSLLKNDKLMFYNKIFDESMILSIYDEVYPLPNSFYGFVMDKTMMKKILIKDDGSFHLYFPSIVNLK